MLPELKLKHQDIAVWYITNSQAHII